MPIPFTPNEMIACERCGAYLPKNLAVFHQCRGSDLHLRPANIPLEKWMYRQRIQKEINNALQDNENFFEDLMRDYSDRRQDGIPFPWLSTKAVVVITVTAIILTTTVLVCLLFQSLR